MDIEVIKRLKKNPHYKLSEEELEALRKSEEKSLEYGFPKIHNHEFDKHSTTIKKKKRL